MFKKLDSDVTLCSIVDILKIESDTVHTEMREVELLVILILTVPGIVKTVERSFSIMRIILTYFEAAMKLGTTSVPS